MYVYIYVSMYLFIYVFISFSVYSPEQTLFNFLIIKCVVQLELIQAVDNFIFYPTITRQDDQNILHASGVSKNMTQPVS